VSTTLTSAGVRDAVGRAERLADDLAGRVRELVEPVGEATGEIHVSGYAALDAARCPARFRMRGEEGWGFPGWAPQSAGAAIARAALQRHLDGDRPFGAPAPLPDPLTSVREWMKARTLADRSVAGWVAERAAQGDRAALAAAAAQATRWMSGFVRVIGWPLPERLTLLRTGDEAAARNGSRLLAAPRVTVTSGADARLGKQVGSGDFAMVLHRPVAGDDDRLRDRVAFEAVAAALAIRIVPARVLVTAGDTGECVRVDVDEALLDLGSDLVAGVVAQRVAATERGWAADDATPSADCRHCELAATCGPGAAWLSGPGRWRGGLPVLPSAPDGGQPVGWGTDGSVVR
jgi:hypothetical protein